MEVYNHLECEYIYRTAVKETGEGLNIDPDTSSRTCGQVLEALTEAVGEAIPLAPADLRREYGSDCLRLYLLFMGPSREYGPEEAWDEDTMAGLFRYLGRVWRKWSLVAQPKEKMLKNMWMGTGQQYVLRKTCSLLPAGRS